MKSCLESVALKLKTNSDHSSEATADIQAITSQSDHLTE